MSQYKLTEGGKMAVQNIYLYHLFVLIMFFSYYEFLDSVGVNKCNPFIQLWKTWLPHLRFASLILFFNLALPLYFVPEWRKGEKNQ